MIIRPTHWLHLTIALLVAGQLLPIASAYSFADVLSYFIPRLECSLPPTSDGPVAIYDNFKNHPCNRQCILGVRMVCVYNLFIHEYSTLGPECNRCLTDRTYCEEEHCIYGDGTKTTLKLVNHQFPSPTIVVCLHDIIVVHIYNNLQEPTTEHWHGVHMEHYKTSDGAPYITDYPIPSGSKKCVTFEADREGTLWYHSHVLTQRAEGVAGNLIIRVPDEINYHRHLYHYDIYSILLHDMGLNRNITPIRNLVVNGMGRSQSDPAPDDDPRHRYARFYVQQNKKYRFRLIGNIVSNCPVNMTLQGHILKVISLDGNDIIPVIANSVHLHAGERIDFIIHANQTLGSYWFIFEGLNDCRNIKQKALLIYEGVPYNQMPKNSFISRVGMTVANAIWETIRPANKPVTDIGHLDGTNIVTVQMQSVHPVTWSADRPITFVYLLFGLGIFGSQVALQINHITFLSPNPFSMLQTCHMPNQTAAHCNATTLAAQNRNCLTSECKCTHVIHVEKGAIVSFVIGNLMGTTHPVHMHGVTFRVVAQGVLGSRAETEKIETLHRQGDPRLATIDITKRNPVKKDVVQLPGFGYVIIILEALNEGFWFMHCHIELHAQAGMMLVLKIGDYCLMKNKLPYNDL